LTRGFQLCGDVLHVLEENVGKIHPTSTTITTAMFVMLATIVGSAIWQIAQDWKMVNEHGVKQE
jgi:hypothetical protein